MKVLAISLAIKHSGLQLLIKYHFQRLENFFQIQIKISFIKMRFNGINEKPKNIIKYKNSINCWIKISFCVSHLFSDKEAVELNIYNKLLNKIKWMRHIANVYK